MSEIRPLLRDHRAEETWRGGVHVELTTEDVTEGLGGGARVFDRQLDEQLDERYLTMCDPRLNAGQALPLAFDLAELLRG